MKKKCKHEWRMKGEVKPAGENLFCEGYYCIHCLQHCTITTDLDIGKIKWELGSEPEIEE